MNERKLKLSDFLAEHGIRWLISKDEQDFPVININLPSVDGLPEEIPHPSIMEEIEDNPELEINLPPDFEDCKGSMRLTSCTRDYPMERNGIVVRFNNVQDYICGECGIERSPINQAQGELMGGFLQYISRAADANDLALKPPSISRVRRALS